MIRPLAAGVAVALALTLLPATAIATIRPQRGMAGVTLKMKQPEVREQLGKPRAVRRGTNDFGPFTQLVYRGGLSVTFQGNGTATAISTTGRSERTARGAGVGSTEDQVRRLVRGVRCETISRVRTCHLGAFQPGRTVTDFLIGRRGRVSRVTVGVVID